MNVSTRVRFAVTTPKIEHVSEIHHFDEQGRPIERSTGTFEIGDLRLYGHANELETLGRNLCVLADKVRRADEAAESGAKARAQGSTS